MSGVIPPLPQCAFMARCLVKAQEQLYTCVCHICIYASMANVPWYNPLYRTILNYILFITATKPRRGDELNMKKQVCARNVGKSRFFPLQHKEVCIVWLAWSTPQVFHVISSLPSELNQFTYALYYCYYYYLFIPLSLRTEHRASTVPRHPRLLFQFLGSIRQLVGFLGGGISPMQGLYLHRTIQHRKT
jgi:hypothetical protein